MVWCGSSSNSNSVVVWLEICELGLVETKKDGEVSKRTRPEGKLIQVPIWRLERDGEDDKGGQI